MNPLQRRAKAKISPPAIPGASDTPESIEQGGGGLSGMLGRAFAQAKEAQAQQANRAVKPRAPAEAPVMRGPKRGPRRQPTAREQSMEAQQASARTRGTAQRGRSALEKMGATQEEAVTPAVMPRRGRGVAGTLAAEQEATDQRAALEATGETGGTRSEVNVTEPSLNEARRRRSRSGRMYRR